MLNQVEKANTATRHVRNLSHLATNPPNQPLTPAAGRVIPAERILDMIPPTDLTHKITATVNQLAQETDAAKLSDAYQQFMKALARFHNYSAGNIALILSANPDAQRVAGFKTWNKLNRYVRKGEHGIPILAPCVYKADDKDPEKTRVYFRVVYVFDVAQTDGEPLPEPPEWKSPEQQDELQSRLIAYAQSLNITVNVQPLDGETQGESRGGEIRLSPTAGTKTLIHELAHELLHKDAEGKRVNTDTKEIEAESVAYAVAVHFGLSELSSPNYIALSNGDAAAITARLQRIVKTASQIITAIDPTTTKESEA